MASPSRRTAPACETATATPGGGTADDTGDDTGTSGGEAPTLGLNTVTFGNTEEDLPYIEILLDATDPQDDFDGGDTYLQLDDRVGENHPIEEGESPKPQDFVSGWWSDDELLLWIADVDPGEHTLVITATDAAGNVSDTLEFETN